MSRQPGTVLLGILVVALVASAAAAPTAGTPDGTQPLTTPDEFDNTLFRITVYENTSAKWTIQHARPLTNQTEIDRFETFAAEFNGQETTTYSAFKVRAENLLRFGRNVTGRDMQATGFSRRAFVSELGQTRGVVEMSFVWTNFGQASDDGVRIGDIFEGGMYIADGQRLELRRGPQLAFTDVQPAPDSMATEGSLAESESVTWLGEQQFAHQRPGATFRPESDVGNRTDAPSTTGPPGGDGPDDDQSDPPSDGGPPFLLIGLVLTGLIVAGIAWASGYLPPGRSTPRPTGGDQSGPAAESTDSPTTAPEVPSEELLSDEDRVMKLLNENGGRMKQVSIVDETDWSKSKVSMLLSDMEEEGRISKLRLGRENIISLAGQEPDAAGSPFDEEE